MKLPWSVSRRIPAPAKLWLRRRWMRARFALPGRTLDVEFDNHGMGFFAQLNVCLRLAHAAERTGKRLHLTVSSANYRDPERGLSWFHDFFDDVHGKPARAGARRIVVRDSALVLSPVPEFTLRGAHDLFFRHFRLRPEIAAAVDEAVAELGIGAGTLGIHFRGTDKGTEAEPVPLDDMLARLRSILAADPDIANVFIASDEARVIERVHREVTERPVVSLSDSRRAEGDDPIHLRRLAPGNYEMGRDALLNALVLSRCGRVMRTTSFLSAWSSIFNPELPVMLLNRPRPGKLWFPEAVVLPRATVFAGG